MTLDPITPPVSAPDPAPELTWADLSEREIVSLPLPGKARPVRFFGSIPLDKAMAISAKHAASMKQGNRNGFLIDILTEVMIEPPLRTPEAANQALRSSFALVSYIVDRVTDWNKQGENSGPNP